MTERRRRRRWAIYTALVALAIITISVAVYPRFARWRNPWSRLERVLDSISLPDQFYVVHTGRHGSPCFLPSCREPRMDRYFASNVPAASVCDDIQKVFMQLPRLREARVQNSSPGYLCATLDGQVEGFYVNALVVRNSMELRRHAPDLPSSPEFFVVLNVSS